GMRNFFHKSASPSRTATPPPSSQHHMTLSHSVVDEKVENANIIITKWNHDDTDVSLFSLHREEAKHYLSSVKDLQSAMHNYISDPSYSGKLVHAQSLMQLAMKRLQKEFHEILRTKKHHLDAESVSASGTTYTLSSRASRSSFSDMDDEDDDEDESRHARVVSETERASLVVMDDLKSIADCMISSGYGKECVQIYKVIRKSIVDEGLHDLGVERLSLSQIQKLDWEVLEIKIKQWLSAVKIAAKSLFYGERILCDHVFSASAAITQSCFAEISREAAMNLFGFPENVAKCKKTPEKMFRTLDLYEAVSDLWPEIESIFRFESISAVRLQAINSLIKLSEAVRTMITDFESAIQKDVSRSPAPGGGVHPLTRYVMNYVTFLADYSGSVSDIITDWPLTAPSPLPEAYMGSPELDESNSSPISERLAWQLLVLLCKLDGKAEPYKDAALSYLFLANNLQYVVVKVRTSNLRFLLGEGWISKHETKVKQYSANYERMGWSKVLASLPENPTAEISPEQVRDCFRRFSLAFEDTCKKQSSWVVPDPRLRDEIKVSVSQKIFPVYQDFYEKNRVANSLVRFTPDDLGNYLSHLFNGSGSSGSVSSNSSHSRGGSSH
ncbi:Exo70 domain-containing protein, partial [Cephalotus follicularis]